MGFFKQNVWYSYSDPDFNLDPFSASSINFRVLDGISKNFFELSLENGIDDLLNLDGIGETQVSSIKSFFENEINIKVLNELGSLLNIKNALVKKNNGLLKGQSFLVTGKLNGISRAEVKSLIEENSGITVSTVSKKLNYLIIGEKPTKRKVDLAKDFKVKTLSQAEWLNMLNKLANHFLSFLLRYFDNFK